MNQSCFNHMACIVGPRLSPLSHPLDLVKGFATHHPIVVPERREDKGRKISKSFSQV